MLPGAVVNRKAIKFTCALWLVLGPSVTLASPTVERADKIAVNISFVGDDQLTQTLVASLEKSLVATGKYELASEGEQKIQLVIPGHVYWQDVKGRTNFHYVVVMVGAGSRYLGTITGSCWFDEMEACARSVVADIARGGAMDGMAR